MFQSQNSKRQGQYNPLFTALTHPSTKQMLRKKNIGGESRESKKNHGKYIFIPLAKQYTKITLNKTEYTVIENHFTVFENPPTWKIGFKSIGHYRLTIKNAAAQKFKLYLYLNIRGELTISPTLISLNSSINSTELSRDDLDTLSIMGLDPALETLLALKKIAKQQHERLLAQDSKIAGELKTVGNLLEKTEQEKYLTIIDKRIKVSELASQFSSYENPVLNNLVRLKQLLKTGRLLNAAKQRGDYLKTEPTSENKATLKKLIFNKKKKKKKKKSTSQVVSQDTTEQEKDDFKALIKYLQKMLPLLEASNAHTEMKALLAKLGTLFFNAGIPFYASSNDTQDLILFEQLQLQFIAKVQHYFKSMDNTALQKALPFLQANYLLPYINLPDRFLLEIIKYDDAQTLQILINNNTHDIFEHTTYDINGQLLTLLETSLEFDSPNCYKCFLKLGFSPLYFSGLHSPIVKNLTSLKHSLRFGKVHLQADASMAHEIRCSQLDTFYDRLISITKDKEQCAHHMEMKKMMSLQSKFQAQCQQHRQKRSQQYREFAIFETLHQSSLTCLNEAKRPLKQLKILSKSIQLSTELLKYISPMALAHFTTMPPKLRPGAESKAAQKPNIELSKETIKKIQHYTIELSSKCNQLLAATIAIFSDRHTLGIQGPWQVKPKPTSASTRACAVYQKKISDIHTSMLFDVIKINSLINTEFQLSLLPKTGVPSTPVAVLRAMQNTQMKMLDLAQQPRSPELSARIEVLKNIMIMQAAQLGMNAAPLFSGEQPMTDRGNLHRLFRSQVQAHMDQHGPESSAAHQGPGEKKQASPSLRGE